jgi:beta-lactamase regulating signal transducer with metallopeptidase domain
MNALLERMGWTLIHTLWEGGLIWLGFELAMVVCRRRSAQTRYLAGCAALALVVIAPWLTFLRLSGTPDISASQLGLSSPQISHPVAQAGAAVAGTLGRSSWRDALKMVMPWVDLVWGLGCLGGALRLLRNLTATYRLAAAPGNPLPDAMILRCRQLAQRLGIRRAVRMGESVLLEVPAVIGWMKPVILIPVGSLAGLSPSQVDAILTHELAHILRHDFPINVLQSMCGVIFFYHPAVRAINARICVERENACDDIAAGMTGDPVGYAAALAQLEGNRIPVALSAGGGDLLGRVRRLLGLPENRENPAASVVWATLATLAVYVGLFLLVSGSVNPVRAEEAPMSDVGFYQVAPGPAQGFRTMTLKVAKNGSTTEFQEETLYVAQAPDLTLADIAGAAGRKDANGRPTLILRFTPAGREKFKAITKERTTGGLRAREAIVVRGILLSAPTVVAEIDSASAVVTGASGLEKFIFLFLDSLPADKRDDAAKVVTPAKAGG